MLPFAGLNDTMGVLLQRSQVPASFHYEIAKTGSKSRVGVASGRFGTTSSY
jgi:hypothetical protein